MSRKLSQDKKAALAHLAKGGDMVAQALIEALQSVYLTPGVVAAGVCHITGQVVNGVGAPVAAQQNVLLQLSTVAVAAVTVTSGTAVTGNGTDTVWLKTDINGAFAINLDDPTVGDLCLVQAETSDGIRTILPVQF